MLPSLRWTVFDEVLDGQDVGVHQVWYPLIDEWMWLGRNLAPPPPGDEVLGEWRTTPYILGEPMIPYPARFYVGEATRVTVASAPYWRVGRGRRSLLVPASLGLVPFLVVGACE